MTIFGNVPPGWSHRYGASLVTSASFLHGTGPFALPTLSLTEAHKLASPRESRSPCHDPCRRFVICRCCSRGQAADRIDWVDGNKWSNSTLQTPFTKNISQRYLCKASECQHTLSRRLWKVEKRDIPKVVGALRRARKIMGSVCDSWLSCWLWH